MYLLLLLPMLGGATACARLNLPEEIPLLFGGTFNVDVEVSSGLNENSPLAVELLIVYDKKLLESMEKMDAATWFKNRKQFLKDQSHKGKVQARKWEWVPGQPKLRLRMRYRSGARGGLVFANYFSVGEHRGQFDPHKNLILVLGDKELTLTPR